MLSMLAQTAKDIGIGAGSATILAVIALLVKRGVTGNFRIGGGESKAEADAADNYNRELCDLRHHQIEEHLADGDAKIEKLDLKVTTGFEHVSRKLDKITDHLMKRPGP